VDRTLIEKSIKMTEDRNKWRKCVHGVANPRIEDGYTTEQNSFNHSIDMVGDHQNLNGSRDLSTSSLDHYTVSALRSRSRLDLCLE